MPARGTEQDLAPFQDKSQIASYALDDVAAMVKSGIAEGMETR